MKDIEANIIAQEDQEEIAKFNSEQVKICRNEYLYKYLDFDGGLQMLKHHNIQFTRADRLNDEYDCNFEILDAPQDIISTLNQILQFGVCSLAISPNNSTLWGNDYASCKGL